MIEQFLTLLNSLDKKEQEISKTKAQVFTILYRLLEKEKGKPITIDVAQLPKDIRTEQWLYYFDNMNIQFLDSSEQVVY